MKDDKYHLVKYVVVGNLPVGHGSAVFQLVCSMCGQRFGDPIISNFADSNERIVISLDGCLEYTKK